jgi:hypothetical protein
LGNYRNIWGKCLIARAHECPDGLGYACPYPLPDRYVIAYLDVMLIAEIHHVHPRKTINYNPSIPIMACGRVAQKESSSVEKLSERLDSTMERLETLEDLVDSNPQYADLAPYLRIALASLRTAVGLYGGPLKIAINASKLTSEPKG